MDRPRERGDETLSVSPRDGRNEAGFSLLEMLVSLSILALLSAVLAGAIQTGARVSDRVQAEAQYMNRQVALYRINGWLAAAMPIAPFGENGSDDTVFTGGPNDLSFNVAQEIYPNQFGYYNIRLSLERDEGCEEGRTLLLSATRMTPSSNSGTPETHKRVIDPCLARPAFRFLATENQIGDAPSWHTEWVETEALPSAVELVVATADGGETTAIHQFLRHSAVYPE